MSFYTLFPLKCIQVIWLSLTVFHKLYIGKIVKKRNSSLVWRCLFSRRVCLPMARSCHLPPLLSTFRKWDDSLNCTSLWGPVTSGSNPGSRRFVSLYWVPWGLKLSHPGRCSGEIPLQPRFLSAYPGDSDSQPTCGAANPGLLAVHPAWITSHTSTQCL